MTPPLTFSELHQQAIAAAESWHDGFTGPDDDWQPSLFMIVSRDGKRQIMFLDVPRMARLPVQLAAVKKADAIRCALVESVWCRSVPLDDMSPSQRADLDAGVYPDGILPSTAPDGREMLTVTAMEFGRVEAWTAWIYRDRTKPPALGDWEPSDQLRAPWIEPIVAALRP